MSNSGIKHFKASFFDEGYYTPGTGKNTYARPFTWPLAGYHCMEITRFIYDNLKPRNALDIGCAKGFQVKSLLYYGIDAHGCDISDWAIAHCEHEAEGRLRQVDIRDGLPYDDALFDLITCMQVLEHVEEEFLELAVSEMHRVTRRWLFIEVPFGNYPVGDPTHVSYFPITFWLKLFKKCGFWFAMDKGFGNAMVFRKKRL